MTDIQRVCSPGVRFFSIEKSPYLYGGVRGEISSVYGDDKEETRRG